MKLTKEIIEASIAKPGDFVSVRKCLPALWRRWLVNIAFRFDHAGAISKFCWRLSRAFATEQVHMALAAYSAGLFMNAVMRGEM